MSRAMNLDLTEAKVRDICKRAGITISALEPLPQGGTHLVCNTGAEAIQARGLMTRYLVEGIVRRFPFYRVRGVW